MKSSKWQDALKQHDWWHVCPSQHVVLRVAPPPTLQPPPQLLNDAVASRILAASGLLQGQARYTACGSEDLIKAFAFGMSF